MRPYIFSFLLLTVLVLLQPLAHSATTSKIPVRAQLTLIKVSPLLEKGRYEDALALLTKYSEKAKKGKRNVHPEIYFAFGNCYAMLENPVKARDSYLKVIQHDDAHLGGWQNLAKIEYEMEHFQEAAASFMKSYQLSLKTRKVAPQFLYFNAVSLLMAQKYSESIATFELLIAKHPKAITLNWKENLVYALMHDNKPQKALPYMVELAEGFTGKKQQKWQEILLQQYMSLNMYDKANKLALLLTRTAPTVDTWWKALTHIHLHQGKYEKALGSMTIYSYLTELTDEEYKLLANLNMQMGIPKNAIPNYEHLPLNKASKDTLLSLVRSYRSIDKLEVALSKLEKFGNQLDRQTLELERGEILYALKRYEEAATAYLKAAEAEGKKKGMASLMAGYSYWQLQEYSKAVEAFFSASEANKYSKEAKKAIQQLNNIIKTTPKKL